MRLIRRPIAAAFLVSSVAVGLAAAPSAAAPEVVRYPSTTCPDTGSKGLDECIDRVDAGSTIVLVDEVIDEAIGIDKSLTLRSESRAHSSILSEIHIDEGAGTLDLTIQDLRVRRRIRAEGIDTGSGHRVVIRRVDVGRDATNSEGIRFIASAPMTLVVEDSRIRTTANQQSGIRFYSARDSGRSLFRAVGNRIDQVGNPSGGAGIDVTIYDAGSTKVEIRSNSIFDVARSGAGYSSGIGILLGGAVRADIDVVGNTVARSATAGFVLGGKLKDGGRLRLDLFDNSFSHSHQGIALSRDLVGRAVTIRTGHNNLYRNSFQDYYEDRGKGPGDLHRDPRFMGLSRGDLRLRADSPLIDRGAVCQSGGLSRTDAAGRHRLHGRSVDIGAFERGSGRPSGVVRLGGSGSDKLRGTAGRDILCGMGGGDTLCARDGKGNDWVDGGGGRDRARADAGDRRRSIEAATAC